MKKKKRPPTQLWFSSWKCFSLRVYSKPIVPFFNFSAKGERVGSEGEEDLEELTDSAEESDENEEHAPPPVTTQVTTPTTSVRHTGRPGVLIEY